MIDALQSWLSTASGLPVVWMNANAPRPSRPYLGLQIINVQATGLDDAAGNIDTATGKRPITGQRTASVTVQAYEKADNADPRSALTRMSGLRDQMRLPSIRTALWAAGLSVFGDPTVQDVPQLSESGYQPQATLDLSLGIEVQTQDDIDWIQTVNGYAYTDQQPFTAEVA